MKRFSHLLAGASWMAEYGDPDKPEDWAYIQTWSPYQHLKQNAKYPTPFYWTNTRDDRVHPAHARKMVAKLEAQGHPVYYFENTEGRPRQRRRQQADGEVTALAVRVPLDDAALSAAVNYPAGGSRGGPLQPPAIPHCTPSQARQSLSA